MPTQIPVNKRFDSKLVAQLRVGEINLVANPPELNITSPVGPIAVSNSVTQHDVSGTANALVVGHFSWTNTLTGASGSLPATTSWSIPGIALAAGVNRIIVSGVDKEAVGQTAANVRKLRKMSVYRPRGQDLRGIRYVGEQTRFKAGKAGKVGV